MERGARSYELYLKNPDKICGFWVLLTSPLPLSLTLPTTFLSGFFPFSSSSVSVPVCILVSVQTTHNLPFHHFFPISSLSAFPMSSSHVTGVCLSSSACLSIIFYAFLRLLPFYTQAEYLPRAGDFCI